MVSLLVCGHGRYATVWVLAWAPPSMTNALVGEEGKLSECVSAVRARSSNKRPCSRPTAGQVDEMEPLHSSPRRRVPRRPSAASSVGLPFLLCDRLSLFRCAAPQLMTLRVASK